MSLLNTEENQALPPEVMELPKRRREFVMALHETGNIAKSGRQAEYTQSWSHRLSQDPVIVKALKALEEYDPQGLTEDQIRQGIAREALQAETARDRLTALQLAAKTKGMLRDVIEQKMPERSQDEFLDDIEWVFGKEAREKAEAELV